MALNIFTFIYIFTWSLYFEFG